MMKYDFEYDHERKTLDMSKYEFEYDSLIMSLNMIMEKKFDFRHY
jgi:hypothetical protein